MGTFNGKCSSTARLYGKTALITGCNTGIGKETAKDFFMRGARVIMACRSIEKANKAADDIKTETEAYNNLGQICVMELDLMSLNSVRKCAEQVLKTEERLDLLINNAGVMMCPLGYTEDGFETQIGTNHFGHFLLTLLLLPKLIKSKPSRIVNVSSMIYKHGKIHFEDINFKKEKYNSINAYSQSKLANVLFTKELARRLEENNITEVNTYSLHPGVINTELGRHLKNYMWIVGWFWRNFAKYLVKTPLEGAQTTIYCAVDEHCANETGLYYSDCAVYDATDVAKDAEVARKLWEVSLDMVGLENNYNPFVPPK